MSNIFQSVSARKPKKSAFNLTHSRKFSFDPGYCYPILCEETLPGDKWSYDMNALVRFQPLISPIMHLVDVCSYQHFVPSRLCMAQSKFEVFITGGEKGDGKDAQGNTVEIPYFQVWGTTPAVPDALFIATEIFADGSLADYLGIGMAGGDLMSNAAPIKVNAMPFLAFWRIWCEYFRDQNLHPDYVNLFPGLFQSSGDLTAVLQGAIAHAEYPFPFFTVPPICWEKDMFTSALPFAQRGAPVETPLSGNAEVVYRPTTLITDVGGDAPFASGNLTVNAGQPELQIPSSVGTENAVVDNIESVQTESVGFTINALRLAARLQEWLEKMARGGARYIEQIKSHFGVVSSDARLQRAEYLAGGKIPVHISEVLQTAENGTTPLAEMAGHGVAAGKVTGFSKFFEEHGYIISVIFIRPKTAYQQGMRRMFTQRFDKLDWAWPSFAHLGEQEVLSKEIFWSGDPDEDDDVFGYQQRYAEYKYIPSTVHGEFKSPLLNHWHWGRIFESRPTLSPEFVNCDPSDRIFNVLQSGGRMYCIVSNRINAIRPLPYYGEPSL